MAVVIAILLSLELPQQVTSWSTFYPNPTYTGQDNAGPRTQSTMGTVVLSRSNDIPSLPARVTTHYIARVGHYYRFKRGEGVMILWGRYAGAVGVVNSAVFQRTVDFPDEYAPGFHIILDSEPRRW